MCGLTHSEIALFVMIVVVMAVIIVNLCLVNKKYRDIVDDFHDEVSGRHKWDYYIKKNGVE